MGSCLTLLTNTETGSDRIRCDAREEIRRQIAVGTVLISDSHLQDGADCRFNRASLRLSNLDQWVNRTPYAWTTDPSDSVRLLALPALKASIPGCEIILSRKTSSHHGQLTDSGFSSHELIELRLAERVTLDELQYRFIRPLEQLLILATGARCEALELRVGLDDGLKDLHSSWPLKSYSVRRRSSDQDQVEQPMIREHMRFGMNSKGYPPNIDFADILPRWYVLQADLSAVCDWIFSQRSDVSGYLQQQMFTIASAVEALHRGLNPRLEEKTDDERARNKAVLAAVKAGCPDHHQWLANAIRFAHRKTYAFRVRELLQGITHLMTEIVGDEEKWGKQLLAIRDGISHVLPSQEDNTMDQMVAMFSSARLFAEVVLLRQLGFTEDECRRSLSHHWERENVRALMKKGFPEWFISRAAKPSP